VLPVPTKLLTLAGAFMLSVFTDRFYENALRFARWLRGWRTAALAPIAVGAYTVAVLVPIGLFDSSLAAQASVSRTAQVVALAPARGQPAPTKLVGSTPIPAVAAAVKLTDRGAQVPSAIVPSMSELAREGHNGYGSGVPADCVPTFPSGVSAKRLCRLGDPASTRVVAVLGDSHAGMWMPALIAAGRAQHFAVVPLNKSSCLVRRITANGPGRPCLSWFRWALAQDRALHPAATIVAFMLTQFENQPALALSGLKTVLSQVTHGVLMADPPGQDKQPAVCITKHGATMRDCSTRVPKGYATLMNALAHMTTRNGHPAIPTMQWFCADGICPMVINKTITTRDTGHLTFEYSTELAPLLGLELKPILAELGR